MAAVTRYRFLPSLVGWRTHAERQAFLAADERAWTEIRAELPDRRYMSWVAGAARDFEKRCKGLVIAVGMVGLPRLHLRPSAAKISCFVASLHFSGASRG